MLDQYQKTPGNLPYVIAVVAMAGLGVFGVVLITLLRPDKDNALLIASVLGFLTPTLMALLAFMKSQETKLLVNGRLDAMMESAKTAAFHEGVAHARIASQAVATTEARNNIERKIDDAQASIENKIENKKL